MSVWDGNVKRGYKRCTEAISYFLLWAVLALSTPPDPVLIYYKKTLIEREFPQSLAVNSLSPLKHMVALSKLQIYFSLQ